MTGGRWSTTCPRWIPGTDHGNHGMGSISLASQVVRVVLTLAMVVAATYLTHLFIPNIF